MTKSEEGVLRTLAFFDVFDYAPTVFELWRWQLKTDRVYSVLEVSQAIDRLGGRVACKHNLYSFPGRSVTTRVDQRRMRALYAFRKNKRVFTYVTRFVRFVFSVKGVALCNTRLPFLYAPNNSDIDLLVIARKGHIWSVRFMLVALLKMLRKRPGEVIADAIDHSIFLSETAMNTEGLADINPIYMAAWTASVDFVYGQSELAAQFEQNNAWVKQYFPAYSHMERIDMWKVNRWLLPFFTVPEQLVRLWQHSHLTPRIAGLANKSTAVVLNDQILKFHANDKRQEYLESYNELCSTIGVPA